MALDRLPGSILADIVEYALSAADYTPACELLRLRLVNRRFDEEVSKAFFDRDVIDIRGKIADNIWFKKPTGTALQKFVRGHIVRPPTGSEVLNTTRRTLRDGVLIASVLLASTSATENVQQIPNVTLPEPRLSTDNLTSKALNQSNIPTVESAVDEHEDRLPDYALMPVCRAYVDLLGDARAFDSWDSSFERDPAQFEVLNDKTGHFWAFLAASVQGQPEVVSKAAKACSDRFGNDEDSLKLKTHFAAGLLLMAKQGHTEAAKALLAHSDMRINLRLQNIRFPSDNAFDVAVAANQNEMIQLLIDNGWSLTTVPMDYLRALKAIIMKMKPCQLRLDLLKTLLEGSCQQWRSDAIVTGMYNELSKLGDVETCKIIMALHQQPPSTKVEYRWQWDFKDNATNETITGVQRANDEEEDFVEEWDADNNYINPEQKAALYYAASNNHRDMISFIFDSKEHFPTTMSLNFESQTQIHCLEHAIKKSDLATFQTLQKYTLPEISLHNLFLYAVLMGNLEVMKHLLPSVDLHAWANSAQSKIFYDWSSYKHPELRSAERNLEDYTNPNSLFFNIYESNPRVGKIGTFMLLCAIKALQVPAARFLLANGCELGTRLVIISPSLFEVRYARIITCHNCGDDTDPCDDCKLHIPRLGKWMAMFSLSRFKHIDSKHMFESGARVLQKRTIFFTRRSRWRLWRWKPETLNDIFGRIITGITIPPEIGNWSNEGSPEALIARFDEMKALMRSHHLPELYWF